MSDTKTIERILKDYLKTYGFDGFAGSDGECGCGFENLFPRGDPQKDCYPAYRQKTDSEGRCQRAKLCS
jgi:hypothetical protein